MTVKTNVGWDTETWLIAAPDDIIPPLVCASWDAGLPDNHDTTWQSVLSTGDGALFDNLLRMWQASYEETVRIIAHNAAFDVTVLMRHCLDVGTSKAKELYLLIWEVLEKSLDNEWDSIQAGEPGGLGPDKQYRLPLKPILVSCSMIRERLLNLSRWGRIVTPPWKGAPFDYSLAGLMKHYLKIDIKSMKQGNDIWRLRYRELDRIPARQWPKEAYEYALGDASFARWAWDLQERRRATFGHSSANSEALQVYADIGLRLYTANGFRVDREMVDKVQGSVFRRLSAIEPALIDNGLLRKNGSCNMGEVKARIEKIWPDLQRQPILTETGEIATGQEVQEILACKDPILDLWAERQSLAKLRDAFLPVLKGNRVWTNFDIMKETGRTSSHKGRGEDKGGYAAFNSQQLPRKVGIRECLLPPAPDRDAPNGYVFGSIDWGAVELCSVAEQTYRLFGWSKHRDKINAGYDLHSYLGAAIASRYEPEVVDKIDFTSSDEAADDAYATFVERRKSKEDPLAPRAKYFRTLAKPVGLGFPGGLGSGTLCAMAKRAYGLDISESEADAFKQLWLETYPEMVAFFDWVRNQTDREHSRGFDDEGRQNIRYCYETAGMRRFRANATYCATANGSAMQSVSADGGKRSIAWLARACCGGVVDSSYCILDKCRLGTFIHDEHLIAIPCDALMTERALAIQELMLQALAIHMPDVQLRAEPALMSRWTKQAEEEWMDAAQTGPDFGWERAMDMAQEQYGTAITTLIANDFRAPGGADKRLVPWDWVNKIKELDRR